MKRQIKHLIIVYSLVTISLSSCVKDNTTSNSGNLTYQGVTYELTVTICNASSNNVYSTSASSSAVSIGITGQINPGTTSLNSTTNVLNFSTLSGTNQASYVATSGTVQFSGTTMTINAMIVPTSNTSATPVSLTGTLNCQ